MSVNWQPDRRFTVPTSTPSHLVANTPTIDGTLLREVSRVQHDKTLQAVRDLLDRIATTEANSRSYIRTDRSAEAFKRDVIDGLRKLREDENR